MSGLNNTDDAVLLVNIKGCGYPPKIRCANFTDTFGEEGIAFPCYPSKENGTVVLTHYVKDEQVGTRVYHMKLRLIGQSCFRSR